MGIDSDIIFNVKQTLKFDDILYSMHDQRKDLNINQIREITQRLNEDEDKEENNDLLHLLYGDCCIDDANQSLMDRVTKRNKVKHRIPKKKDLSFFQTRKARKSKKNNH